MYANNWFVKILKGVTKEEILGSNFKEYFALPSAAEDFLDFFVNNDTDW